MADVPDDLVTGRVERGAEGHGQLDDTEPGADVTAGLRYDVDETLPHFARELLQLLRRERLDVLGTVNRFENQLGLVTM